MAKNTGRSTRQGTVIGRVQTSGASSTWIKRDTSSGRFVDAKRSGGSFTGIKRQG